MPAALRGARTVVVVVALEDDLVLGHRRHQLVRAGADRVGAEAFGVGFDESLRHDLDDAETLVQQRERELGGDLDGVIVDSGDRVDEVHEGREQ